MNLLLRSSIGLSLLGLVLGEDYETDGFCNFKGILLPLFGASECQWPNIIRIVLYMTGLFWTFLGVGVISDIFMGGIEKVTSQKRRTFNKETKQWRTHYVWNDTVANLTLMALGSSAPEILLSLIEITFDNMFLGDLGAGTIVGSAAFNLLIISGVCICAIPDGEVRYIKQTKVFYVTAFFSVFAYMWLMIILMFISPNVTDLWEALVTLLFCPTFVFLAFLADKGYFDSESDDEKKENLCLPDGDMTEEEIERLMKETREKHGSHLTDDQVIEVVQIELKQRKSKAQYQRMGAEAVGLTHRKRASVAATTAGGLDSMPLRTLDNVDEDRQKVIIKFGEEKYIVKEDCEFAKIKVIRDGCLNVKCYINYETVEGTAKEHIEGTTNGDFTHTKGVLCFSEKETEKDIMVPIIDDQGCEESEYFYIKLGDPWCEKQENSSCQASISGTKQATVIILDDDQPGKMRFARQSQEYTTVDFKTEEGKPQTFRIVNIQVKRFDGVRGEISCKWKTENFSAKAGLDYEEDSGEVKFTDEQTTYEIPINIKERKDRTTTERFLVKLEQPSAGSGFDPNTDGGAEEEIFTVELLPSTDETQKEGIAKMRMKLQSVNNTLGNKNYYEQFHSALFVVGDPDDDDDDEAKKNGPFDYFMHFVTMPWNVLFACVPPPDYCGGWACFTGSLCCIAIVTAIVGDLANLVGCCLGINGEITAITFVALGTSLPDTFASMAAAKGDPYADASIGNVTGSNSVNVFMGIGVSWLLAAIYWASHEPNEKWYETLRGLDSDVQQDIIGAADCSGNVAEAGFSCKNAVFMTPAGSIWFNLMVYVLNALFAIGLLELRRKKWGGELGGPLKGWLGQYQSGAFMFTQWFIYIVASSIYATINSKEEKNWDKYFI
jgi:solute carrier family 8 (sodium/calcium exchanger)